MNTYSYSRGMFFFFLWIKGTVCAIQLSDFNNNMDFLWHMDNSIRWRYDRSCLDVIDSMVKKKKFSWAHIFWEFLFLQYDLHGTFRHLSVFYPRHHTLYLVAWSCVRIAHKKIPLNRAHLFAENGFYTQKSIDSIRLAMIEILSCVYWIFVSNHRSSSHARHYIDALIEGLIISFVFA